MLTFGFFNVAAGDNFVFVFAKASQKGRLMPKDSTEPFWYFVCCSLVRDLPENIFRNTSKPVCRKGNTSRLALSGRVVIPTERYLKIDSEARNADERRVFLSHLWEACDNMYVRSYTHVHHVVDKPLP